MNADWTIAYLEARVAYLEKQLVETSAIYRAFVREACDEDVTNASRAAMGLRRCRRRVRPARVAGDDDARSGGRRTDDAGAVALGDAPRFRRPGMNPRKATLIVLAWNRWDLTNAVSTPCSRRISREPRSSWWTTARPTRRPGRSRITRAFASSGIRATWGSSAETTWGSRRRTRNPTSSS